MSSTVEKIESPHPKSSTLAERVVDELWSFAILAGYLFICFGALLYLKFSILEAQGVTFAPWGFAAIKALIVAKFLLIGRALERRRQKEIRPLIVPTLYNSAGALLLLMVLMIAEEVIVGLIHGRSVWDSVVEIGGGTFHQRIATIGIMLLILLPLFALRALGDVVGYHTLSRLFFELRHKSDDA
jgi:hypothetical protein